MKLTFSGKVIDSSYLCITYRSMSTFAAISASDPISPYLIAIVSSPMSSLTRASQRFLVSTRHLFFKRLNSFFISKTILAANSS